MTVNETMVSDDGVAVVNDTDVPTTEVIRALRTNPEVASFLPDREMAAIVTWSSGNKLPQSRRGSIFDRDKFVTPSTYYEKMRLCYEALGDDTVASYLDSSEALAFSRVNVECDDQDEQDVWEQVCMDVDFSSRLREVWRELNIVSQATVACWYGTKSYNVRGKGESGIKRKKTFSNLTVPLGITVLDPFKVVPVGNFLFNQEILTYYADPTEKDVIDSWLLGDDASGADPIIQQLIVAKYEPDYRDRKEIGNLGVDPNRLYILNPKYVWRTTLTRAGFDRYPQLRMESVFELLDLKRQLRAMDRSNLIGASNYLLLIKKGTDKEPAKPFEIGALQEQVRNIAKVPVIVGDHRLSVEIITPKTDTTLQPDRYEAIDSRIMGRLYGFFFNERAGRSDDSVKLARVVARGMETRRSMEAESFLRNVFMPIYNLNDQLRHEPRIVFHPKSIALDFDSSRATYLLDLYDRGMIARKSLLDEADYDMLEEAATKRWEKQYEALFDPPPLPAPAPPDENDMPNSPAKKPTVPGGAKTATPKQDPKVAGRSQGGNHGQGGNGNVGRGAGQAAQPKTKSPQVNPRRQPKSPNTTTK